MKIRMLRDFAIHENGKATRTFKGGEVYELEEYTAKSFIEKFFVAEPEKPKTNRFWNAEYNGEVTELQSETPEYARDWLRRWYSDKCSWSNGGEYSCDEGYIFEVETDDDGNDTELQRKTVALFYEPERSQFEQHNTYGM